MKQLGFGLELRLHGPQLNLEDWHLLSRTSRTTGGQGAQSRLMRVQSSQGRDVCTSNALVLGSKAHTRETATSTQ